MRLLHDSQAFSGDDRFFERSTTSALAIEGETRLRGTSELSLGFEIMRYANRYRRVSSPTFEDTMTTRVFLARSNYYFRPGKELQPYLGGGIGIAYAYDYGGPIHGYANGNAYQGVAGLQLRADRVGFRVEYMALRARAVDDDGERIDASSRGVFVAVGFFFGRP